MSNCEFTQDYPDEKSSIVCRDIEGDNVLIDIDEYLEGYSPNESRPPCPNCDLDGYVEYHDIGGAFDSPSHKQEFKVIVMNEVKERMSMVN